jgi:flagellar protein FlaJ
MAGEAPRVDLPPPPRARQAVDAALRWGPVLVLALAAVGGALTLLPGGSGGQGYLAAGIVAAFLVNVVAVRHADWARPAPGGHRWRAQQRALHALGFLGGVAVLVSAAIDAFAAAQRFRVLDLSDVAGTLIPFVGAFVAVCLALAAGALLLALRSPGPALGRVHRWGAWLTALAALAGLALAGLIVAGRLQSFAGKPLTPLDAVFALNFAAGAALLGALLARRVPTPFRAPGQVGSARAILYPALAGVVVVFAVLATLATTSLAGARTYARILPPLLILVAAFLVIGTLAVLVQARGQRPPPLYVQRMAPERRRRLLIVGLGLAAGGVVLFLALQAFTGRLPRSVAAHAFELLLLAPLVAMTPLAVYDTVYESRRIRLEDRVPDLLRDLAASRRAGLTLPKAVTAASQGNYDALDPEVQMMAHQVSWDMPFEEALDRMAQRIGTPGVQAVSAVVREASASGGEVHDVLQVVGEQRREARELESERRQGMALYGIVIYVSFFVFLTILLMLDATFLPAIARAGARAPTSGLPGGTAALGIARVDLADYRRLFLVAAFVQGVGDGIVAGVMGTGRVGSGLKHAVIMGSIGVLAFMLLLPARV